MKKFNNEKGVITIVVLVSILFMVSFLISSYVIVANKVKTQKEMVEQTKAIYDNSEDVEQIYNSFFIDNVIPIYTVDQLLKIGDEETRNINGTYYKFKNDDSTIYILMNDLEFNAYDYGQSYYWTPIGDNKELLAGFNGNKHKIEVRYKDSENTEYSIIYSEENNFSEPEYKVKVSPRALLEEGEILNNAITFVAVGDNDNFIEQEAKGEIDITVKRLTKTRVKMSCEGYKDSGTATIYIENPDKRISSIKLVLGNYSFTINATPANAKVTINGIETTTVSVNKGETITWKVEAENYTTQEGSQVIDDDTVLNISLNIIRNTLTIEPSPSDATVTISANGEILASGEGMQKVEVDKGTVINYSINRIYYYAQSGDITMNTDYTIPISLEQKPEQTIILTPTSVSASDWTDTSNANSDIDSSSYAMSWHSDKLHFNFDASEINENAKITSIIASYKLGYTVASRDAIIILDANGVECINTKTESIVISGGKVYEASATTLPTAMDMRTALDLSISKAGTGSAILRIYGARLTITYIDP